MAEVVRVDDLYKEYSCGERTVVALGGVDFALQEGEMAAIMGASGSGKSTLLHLIGGLDRPTRGSVKVAGYDLSSMSDFERTVFRRRKLGIVFQGYNLIPTLTAEENIALPALLDGRNGRETSQRASVLLDRVDLRSRSDHRPQAMSGGEQQRVAIARALMNNPALILADEPTGNLDSRHGREIWELLRQLTRNDGCAVLVATHDPIGAAHADRIVVLKDGGRVGEFSPPVLGDGAHVATRYAELVGEPR